MIRRTEPQINRLSPLTKRHAASYLQGMTYTDPAEIQPRPETPTWLAAIIKREELALPQGTVTEPHSLITSDRS